MLISKKLANEEISKQLQNVAQASGALAAIVNSDSKNYFTTAPQSFVFLKAEIESLWNLNPTADGLKVYKASQPDGTPTLVLVACKTNASAEKLGATNGDVVNLIGDENNAAVQFPNLKMIKNTTTFDIALDA